MSYLIVAPILIGFIAFALGIHRVSRRSGLEYDGVATAMQLTPEQHKKQRDRFWMALFDPKHPRDRWMVFGGFGAVMATMLSMTFLVELGIL